MPLPSQSARPQSRSTHMYRRRKPRRTVVLLMLSMLLGLTISVWAWTRSSDRPQPQTTEEVAVADEPDRFARAEPGGPQRPNQSRSAASPADDTDDDDTPRIQMGQRVPLQSSSPSADEGHSSRSSADGVTKPLRKDASPGLESGGENSGSAIAHQPSASSHEPPKAESREPRADKRVTDRLRTGMELLASNKPVEARRVLTQALQTPGIDRRTARDIRETLTELNERLIFGHEILPDDPHTFGYTIRPGDTLARIASRQNTNVDWRFIQRINGISRPEAIRAGQQIKLVQGPVHAVVVKKEFRLDVFLGEGSDRVFVRSFPVGLGEHDSTPVGRFRVRRNSKLINPAWTNPRTGEHFTANDPENPIGTRWIGIEGITESIRDLAGYGLHGTIDPESIGEQQSMGCVRLKNEHVELLYEMLVERESTVEIRE